MLGGVCAAVQRRTPPWAAAGAGGAGAGAWRGTRGTIPEYDRMKDSRALRCLPTPVRSAAVMGAGVTGRSPLAAAAGVLRGLVPPVPGAPPALDAAVLTAMSMLRIDRWS